MDGLQDRIFISFSSADRKIARGICDDLEKHGSACWISSRDVRGGENYQEAIVQAIRSVKVMVLVFSENANASNEIKKELALASQTNTVVIPFRVQNAMPNAALAYELATRQWIDAFEDREDALRILDERIRGIVSGAGETQTATEPRSADPIWRTAPPPAGEVRKEPILIRFFKSYVSETSKPILLMFGLLFGAVLIWSVVGALRTNDTASSSNRAQGTLLTGPPQQLITSNASPELLKAVADRDELAKLVDEKQANLRLQQSYYDQAAKSGNYDQGSLMKLKSGVDNATRELTEAQARMLAAQRHVLLLQAAANLKQ